MEETTQLLTAHPEWSGFKQEAMRKEISYLQSHASRTRYGYYQAQGWFIGSGVIEAGCKTVVGRRLKQSGMFWGESGAENILSLRCLILGPHFEDAWKTRRSHLTHEHSKAPKWSN